MSGAKGRGRVLGNYAGKAKPGQSEPQVLDSDPHSHPRVHTHQESEGSERSPVLRRLDPVFILNVGVLFIISLFCIYFDFFF